MNRYFITGSSRGIGLALVERLLVDPANQVVGMARTAGIEHPRYDHITVDLSQIELIDGIDFTLPDNLRRAVLVNNAGTIQPISRVGTSDGQALQRNITLNLIAPMVLMHAFVRATAAFEGQRTIINLGSGAGRHPVESWGPYCAAKAGMDMFSRVLATEQALAGGPNPVLVFSVAPGTVDTDMQAEIRNTADKVFSDVNRFIQLKKKGQLWQADRVAELLIKIIANPRDYPEVCLDIRDLNG
jgi:NAD(P)-dependent dehydrogenase (short-subunit alcohol dehydrogenase family)